MQKFSIAFVCCLMLLFTACKKETLLETNQDLNPQKNLIATKTLGLIDVKNVQLNVADSISIDKELKGKNSVTTSDQRYSAFPGQCGNSLVYKSCYYSYEIWNDATNVYIDFSFPSQYVATTTKCTTCGDDNDDDDGDDDDGHHFAANGTSANASALRTPIKSKANSDSQAKKGGGKKNDGHDNDDDNDDGDDDDGSGGTTTCVTCQNYISLNLSVNLFNAAGVKVNTIYFNNPSITITSYRITIPITSLVAINGSGPVKCLSLAGSFSVFKKCGTSAPERISSICISGSACNKYCLQICPPPPIVCPTVATFNADKTSLCGSGTVSVSAAITGDATKVATTWTVDGQTFTGNTKAISFAANTSCEPQIKVINAKSICTSSQEVLKEASFEVTINPVVTSTVNTDNYECASMIEFSCPLYLISDITWTIGSTSGRGYVVPISSAPEVLNYSYTAFGCSYSGTQNNVYCLPALKKKTIIIEQ